MKVVETEAIVLHTHKLAEADKIAVCMTQKAGLVRGVARGSRRLKSKFGASLEPFTLINLTFHEKEARELVTIRNAEIIKSYFGAARDPQALASLEYLAELVREFAAPHHSDEKLFRMLRACVEALADDPEAAPAIFAYSELWALRITGFLPDFTVCGGCGRGLGTATEECVYITNEGVVWCRTCHVGGGQLLKGDVYGLLYALRTQRPTGWSKAYAKLPEKNRQVVSEIAKRLVRRTLEKEIKRGPKVSRPESSPHIELKTWE
jgi:DNA repair protein RecO (recombination protein O)